MLGHVVTQSKKNYHCHFQILSDTQFFNCIVLVLMSYLFSHIHKVMVATSIILILLSTIAIKDSKFFYFLTQLIIE